MYAIFIFVLLWSFVKIFYISEGSPISCVIHDLFFVSLLLLLILFFQMSSLYFICSFIFNFCYLLIQQCNRIGTLVVNLIVVNFYSKQHGATTISASDVTSVLIQLARVQSFIYTMSKTLRTDANWRLHHVLASAATVTSDLQIRSENKTLWSLRQR